MLLACSIADQSLVSDRTFILGNCTMIFKCLMQKALLNLRQFLFRDAPNWWEIAANFTGLPALCPDNLRGKRPIIIVFSSSVSDTLRANLKIRWHIWKTPIMSEPDHASCSASDRAEAFSLCSFRPRWRGWACRSDQYCRLPSPSTHRGSVRGSVRAAK